jgi:hypothetical protein
MLKHWCIYCAIHRTTCIHVHGCQKEQRKVQTHCWRRCVSTCRSMPGALLAWKWMSKATNTLVQSYEWANSSALLTQTAILLLTQLRQYMQHCNVRVSIAANVSIRHTCFVNMLNNRLLVKFRREVRVQRAPVLLTSLRQYHRKHWIGRITRRFPCNS